VTELSDIDTSGVRGRVGAARSLSIRNAALHASPFRERNVSALCLHCH
jgi:hypothetical protein